MEAQIVGRKVRASHSAGGPVSRINPPSCATGAVFMGLFISFSDLNFARSRANRCVGKMSVNHLD